MHKYKKVQVLQSSIGGKAMNFFMIWEFQLTPTTRLFMEIVEHSRLIIYSNRSLHLSISTITDVTISQERAWRCICTIQYLAFLCWLATKRCSFGTYLKEALHNWLACALRNKGTQRHLLTEMDVDIATAIKIVPSMGRSSEYYIDTEEWRF